MDLLEDRGESTERHTEIVQILVLKRLRRNGIWRIYGKTNIPAKDLHCLFLSKSIKAFCGNETEMP